jgi:hypothetical protein
MENEIFEDWSTFKTGARKEFIQAKRDLEYNVKQNFVLLERRAYLQSLCEWIDEEDKKLAIGK